MNILSVIIHHLPQQSRHRQIIDVVFYFLDVKLQEPSKPSRFEWKLVVPDLGPHRPVRHSQILGQLLNTHKSFIVELVFHIASLLLLYDGTSYLTSDRYHHEAHSIIIGQCQDNSRCSASHSYYRIFFRIC